MVGYTPLTHPTHLLSLRVTRMETWQPSLVLPTREGQVTILDEPTYSFSSADNLRTYDVEIRLDPYNISSIHGVRLDGKWSAVFGASAGPSRVHQDSAIEL